MFLLFVIIPFFVTCQVIGGSANKICLADGCIGFTSPIVQLSYSQNSTFELTVTTDKPWQLVFVDGACGSSIIELQVCTETDICIDQQLASSSFTPMNYDNMAAAQADPLCANTIRSFVGMGPPVNNGPTIDPNILSYPVNYRVKVTLGVESLSPDSYGFLQILPFFGTSCTFTSGLLDFSLVMPWKAYVNQSTGFSLYDVCSSRGMVAYQSTSEDIQVVLDAIATLSACPYVQTMTIGSFIFGTNQITDPNSCQLWTEAMSGTVITGLQCAQIPTIYPVVCIIPPNYGSLPSS